MTGKSIVIKERTIEGYITFSLNIYVHICTESPITSGHYL